MATVVTEEIKKELVSRGIWGDFVRRREDLSLSQGMKGFAASRAAMEELAPDLYEGVKPRGRPKKEAGFVRTLADVKREKKDERRAEEVSQKVGETVSKETFAGKTCSISTAFMWAYSNLCFSDVRPEDAPSAVAWQMFLDMRTSPSLKADMLKSGLGAAMRKAENEDTDGIRFDGANEYDILGAIAEAKA